MEAVLELWLKFQVFVENTLGISMDTLFKIVIAIAIVMLIVGIIKRAVKSLITLVVIALVLTCGSKYINQAQEKLGIYIDTKAQVISIELNRADPDYRMNFYFTDKNVVVRDRTDEGTVELYNGKINSLTTYGITRVEDKTYINIVDSSSRATSIEVQESRADLVEKVASSINTVCSVSFKGITSDIEGLVNDSLSMDEDPVEESVGLAG